MLNRQGPADFGQTRRPPCPATCCLFAVHKYETGHGVNAVSIPEARIEAHTEHLRSFVQKEEPVQCYLNNK